jgi:hypothetical protein
MMNSLGPHPPPAHRCAMYNTKQFLLNALQKAIQTTSPLDATSIIKDTETYRTVINPELY